ncbi:hypothetical protein HYT55_00490 [Candidatus Woesearchaeota archaeon]|nr:hypothetical protein [Candidatus Woesearchaeota archaeon]
MSPKQSWSVISLLSKLEYDNRLTPRAQTVAKLLALDLQKIKEDIDKAGNYWYDLQRYQKDEIRLQARQELFQRYLNRVTAQMEILYEQLRGTRKKEVKDVLVDVVSRWNSIMESLVKQYPSIEGCKKARICKTGELCCIGWEG